MGFVCFPCSECVPVGVFSSSGRTHTQCRTHPSALNPKDGTWGLRAGEVVQLGFQNSLTPTHISPALRILLSRSGCNREAGSLGAGFGGSALGKGGRG